MDQLPEEKAQDDAVNKVAAGIKAELFINDHLKDVNAYSDDIKVKLAVFISKTLNIPIPAGIALTGHGIHKVVFVGELMAKLQAVKCVKDATGKGLKESKDLVDKNQTGLEGSYEYCMDVAKDFLINGIKVEVTPVGIFEEEEDLKMYDLILLDPGASRLSVMKVACTTLGMKLAASKAFVDNYPVMIISGVNYKVALGMKREFEAAGAKTTLERVITSGWGGAAVVGTVGGA